MSTGGYHKTVAVGPRSSHYHDIVDDRTLTYQFPVHIPVNNVLVG